MATGTAGNPIVLDDDTQGAAPQLSSAPQNPNPAKRARTSPKTPKPKPSTLGIHTDGCVLGNAKLRELGFRDTIVQSGLHAVATTFIAGLKQTEPASACYTMVQNPAEHKMRRINVPAGAAVFWNGWTPHANENPDCPTMGIDDCEYDVTATTIEGAIEKLGIYGVAVLLDVLNADERQAAVDGMIADLRRAAPPGTPVSKLAPPGSNGCLIVKCYGLPNTTNAQRFRLNPKIREFYSTFYGVPPVDLTLSNDGLTWKPPPSPSLSSMPQTSEIPKRCGAFISWGPHAAMGPKEATKKLKAMEAGKSLSHNPTRARPGGGPGHMSNPKEGNPGHWTTLYDPIGPAQRQALGIIS